MNIIDMHNLYYRHLHVHTEFSLLDGAMKIDGMVEKLKKMGHDAIAITEHGNMYSLIKANKACKEAGIKHIIGCEFYVAPTSRLDKSSKRGETAYHHLIVLAKDHIGYQQLIRMCSLGFMEGFYYRPRIDHELLFGNEPGHLVVSTACIGSAFAAGIMNGIDISDFLALYVKHFGDDFYLEVQNHGIPMEEQVMGAYEHYSEKMGIPIIASTDVHYLDKEDAEAHDITLCIAMATNLADSGRFRFEGTGYHLMSTEEVASRLPIEYMQNTKLIVDKCEGDILSYGKIRLPKFNVPLDDPGFRRWLDNEQANLSAGQ